MGRYLNVGIIQMPIGVDTAANLAYMEERIAAMMGGVHRPELILGVECMDCFTPQYIPGPMTDYFSKIAKKYGIYFIPGTMYEKSDDLPEEVYYNSAPIFNPKGEIVDVYRKLQPWKPVEDMVAPGNRYVVFDIPEKQTKVGVQICYDLNFPEISRAETLMGAEVLVKLTMDPQELYLLNEHVHYTRALENQAYLVSTNGVGDFLDDSLYGHSLVIDPQGKLQWEASQSPSNATVTLDLDLVDRCRRHGTMFMDHYMQHLRDFPLPPMPNAEDITKAPLYKDLPAAPVSVQDYEEDMKSVGSCTIGNLILPEFDCEALEKKLDEFLKSR